jgi:hypothetical protein
MPLNVPSSHFNADGYKNLLRLAQGKGYRLCRMDEAFASDAKTMILRHDIDFSMDYALAMAELEAEMGATSTYFFMTTCEYYNPFSEPHRAALRRIAALGHEVGLHWDSRALPEDKTSHAAFLSAQLTLLAAASGHEIRSASQHIPIDTPPFDISPYIENNAYSARFNQRFTYVSDSSMVWRKVTPWDLMAEDKEIQFLSHPIWWMTEGVTQDEKMREAMARVSATMAQWGEEFLVYMKGILAEREKYDSNFAKIRKHS